VQKRVAQRLLSLLEGQKRPAGAILEVGCGTGLLSRRLAEVFGGERLVLSDLAHAMTRTASGRFPACRVVDADAAALPFADGRFSLVASSSVYQWVDDREAALADAARVLVPGGLLALAMFGEGTLEELRTAHRQAVAECGRGGSSHVQDFTRLGDLEKAAVGAGLDPLQLCSETEIDWHADVPHLLRSLKRIGASNAAGDRPPGMASRRVMQHMMQAYTARYGTGRGIPASYRVFYLLARRT
jgi:malonyl-CoA O-methyltransferase